jgi:hypothetical protein
MVMACVSEFGAEMNVHFPGLQGISKAELRLFEKRAAGSAKAA